MDETLFRQYLLYTRVVDEIQLEMAQTTYPDVAIEAAIEKLGFATEDDIYMAMSRALDIPFVDLNVKIPSIFAVRLLLPWVLKKHQIVPLSCDSEMIEIATSCPGDINMIDDVAFATDRTVVERLARRHQILETLRDLLGEEFGEDMQMLSQAEKEEEEQEEQEQAPEAYLSFDDMDSENMARHIVNRLLKNAIQRNASDMHIEPRRDKIFVRDRVDGELHIVSELPFSTGKPVVGRMKVLSRMDIAEQRRPQDGSFTVKTRKNQVDLRVSSIPTPFGEKMVIRFLYPNRGAVEINEVGMLPDTVESLLALSNKPQGMIVVTGPTGSGKSSSLCAIINSIKSEDTNIISVEDPIEYKITGVNQIAVNEKQGVTFASALRAILRQDPDVVYVGEIRDPETAKIAVQAAQTGHMVFSTLHTNDASSAVTRLLNLDVEPHNIAASLTAVLAQRLSRRVCRECAYPVSPNQDELKALQVLGRETQLNLIRGQGCTKCFSSGYSGRIAITELLIVDDTVRQYIIEKRSASDINEAARKGGMRTMWETALLMVASGVSTLEEVSRHVPRTFVDGAVNDTPQSILIADDDPEIQKLLEMALRPLQATVYIASDGEMALAMAMANKPDFIITDVNMPKCDGITLCRRLRSSPSTNAIPVIILTADGTEEAEISSLETGANDFVRKPFNRKTLPARVRAVYKRAKG
jgi:type IV pilus assembly protein PilB